MTRLIRTARASAACAAIIAAAATTAAFASEPEHVIVTATRLHATIGQPTAKHHEGRPIPGDSYEARLEGRVSLEGLDLTTPAGAAALEKRVGDTAWDVCDRLGRAYPNAGPDTPTCASEAVAAAKPQIDRIVVEAKKRAGKGR